MQLRIVVSALLLASSSVTSPAMAEVLDRGGLELDVPLIDPPSVERAAILLGDELVVVDRITYEVAPGDTLGAIALEYGVSVSDLRRWNGIRGDRINIGQELTIHTRGGGGDRVRETYVVRSGDTGTAIARRQGVTLAELQRWNRGTNLDRLRIGQELTIYVAGAGDGGSTGTPQRGRLRGGQQLEDGTGYIVRNPERSYGLPGTVSAIRNGIARVTARYVNVPALMVHDLSFERGGRMEPHASHQNGLDVDISFYRNNCEDDVCDWRDVEPEELDARLQWYLFKSWIDQGLVEYIFVDYDLQEPLYDYARARGASDEQLEQWFEYPNRGSGGIIRHESGHDDHFHVRFNVIEE